MLPRFRILLPVLLLLGLLLVLFLWVQRDRGEVRGGTRTPTAGPPNGPAPAQGSGAERGSAPVPVLVGEVTLQRDEVELALSGSAGAIRSVTLFPAAAGEVRQLLFSPGQRVRAGQVLLQLVNRPQQLTVETAAARVEQARRLLARYESTRGTGAVPGSVIDEAQAALRLAEIEERQAREALADRTLRAPFDGVVGLATVEPGDRVAIETPITTLDDRRTLLVAFQVPEAHAAQLRVGHPVSVSNPAFPGRRFEGRVAQLDSRLDAATRNLSVRAAVPNPQDLLRPGMSFDVRLVLGGQAEVPAVPELALQWDREGPHVWRVDQGNSVQRVPVRPVRRAEGRVLVQAELQRGQRVVVEGVQRLRPGRGVRIIQSAAEGAQATPPRDGVAQ